MWPGRVSNPGPLTYESGALPTALRGPASFTEIYIHICIYITSTPLPKSTCFKPIWYKRWNACIHRMDILQGGETRGLNDRVHGISCLYSDKTCKKINYISTNTYSIIMH